MVTPEFKFSLTNENLYFIPSLDPSLVRNDFARIYTRNFLVGFSEFWPDTEVLK